MSVCRRFCALLPESLATRGTLVLVLAVASVALPAYVAYRTWAEVSARRHAYERESLLALALEACVEHDPNVAAVEADAVYGELRGISRRVRWAGVFSCEQGVTELRRQTTVPAETIGAQIDPTGRGPVCKALMVDGAPSRELELVTVPQPGGRGVLAVVLQRDPETNEGLQQATWVGLICLAIGGLGLAWAWFRFGIEQPVRQLTQRLGKVQSGLDEAAAVGGLPTELADVARAISTLQTDLAGWRAQAEHWRSSIDTAVAAQTRHAKLAQRRAEREAETDALTRLSNRRVLERELPRLFAEHQGRGTELTLVMFDVDRFKALNDTQGHRAGDAVLSFLGDLIRATTRKERDLTVRYGGDEFVLVMPGTSCAVARDVAQRITQLFAQQARTFGDLEHPPGLSFGLAALQEYGARSGDELLRMADAAMYAAKRSGQRIATFREAGVGVQRQ
jgi:diguanylate cyclase (GGDEF)-like protein